MISSIYRAAASLALAALALPAAAARPNEMPDALTGVWSDDDADGREQCALWRKDPVSRDDGYDPLVGAVVITKGLIHSYAEYGEGNFYRIERVDAAGAGRCDVGGASLGRLRKSTAAPDTEMCGTRG